MVLLRSVRSNEGVHGDRLLLDGPAVEHIAMRGGGAAAGDHGGSAGLHALGIVRHDADAVQGVILFEPITEGAQIHHGRHGGKAGGDVHAPLPQVDLHIGDKGLFQSARQTHQIRAAGKDRQKWGMVRHNVYSVNSE